MAALDIIASELLKSANEADLNYKKTRDQAQRDKAIRLRKIVENLRLLTFGASDLNGLSDVTISAPANAQVLTYNSTTGQWENQTPGGGGGGGDMYKSTYDVDNDGIVDGSETTQIIVRNSTGSTLTKGQVVYLSGATGNRPNAVLSQANTEATSSKTIGIVVANINNNSDGFVAVNGTLHNLDTSAFADGVAVWLSATTAGAFTSTIPAEPNHTVFIGYIARSHPTQGRLVILIQNGYELNELHGVQIASEANNDLLVYESSSTLWKNKSISTIFGGTPLVSVPTLAQVTTAGNTTTNAIIVGNATVNGPVNSVFAHTPTTNYTGFGGVQLNAADGTERGFFKLSPGTGEVKMGAVGSGYFTTLYTAGVERMRIFFSTGNVAINSTTDAGYKLDVNGTARVSDTATIAKALNITGTVAVTGTGTTYANTFSSNINGTFSNATIATLLVNEASFSGTGSGILSYAIVAGSSLFSNITANSLSTFRDSAAAQLRVQGYNILTGASGDGSGTLLLTNRNSGAGALGLAATYGGGGSRISIFNQYNDGGTNSTSQIKVNITGTDIAIFAGSGELAIGKGAALSGASLTTSTSITAASAIARGVYFNNTLVAAANNDVLVGLDINPTFTNGAFTGVSNLALRVAYVAGRYISFTQRPGYADYGRIQFTSVTGGDIYSSGRIDLIPSDTDQSVGLGNGLTSRRLASSTNYGTYGPTPPGFQVGTNAAFVVLSANADVNTDSFVFSGPTGARHFFKVVQNNVPYFTIMPTGNVLVNTTTDAGYKLDVVGADSRFNGVRVGLGAGGVSGNTAVGNGALNVNTTGSNNTAIGFGTLLTNTVGNQNTAIGSFALNYNIGSGNTAIGYYALLSNSTGGSNVAIGSQSLQLNSTGGANIAIGQYAALNTNANGNIAIGNQAIYSNTAGTDNVGIGNSVLRTNVTGINNVAVGTTALFSNTASNNTAVGYQAGYSNTSGSVVALGYQASYSHTTGSITAVGYRAAYSNVSGFDITAIGYEALTNSTGNYNTALGYKALTSNTGGATNTAVGRAALFTNTTAGHNTGLGFNTLFANNTASHNTGLGSEALRFTTGGSNTAIGSQAGNGGVPNTTGANNIFIGYQSTGVSATESNRTWIGNSSTTSTWLAGNVLIGTTTDAGYKLDVNGTTRVKGNVDITTSGGTNVLLAYSSYVQAWQTFYVSQSGGTHNFVVSNASSGGNAYFNNVNVGIGTTSPTEKLHIVDNTNGNKFARISAGAADASAAWVAQNDQVDNIVYRVFGSGVSGSQMGIALARSASLMANLGGSGKFLLGTYSNTDFVMGTGNAEKMRIVDSTGNILIATTTDLGNKLEVNGTINATAYKINNVLGYTGILNIPGNPPGQQNVDIQGGIIVNIF